MAVENTPLEGVHHWRACAFSILHPYTSRPEHLTEAFLNAVDSRNCRTGVLDAQRSSLVKLLDTFLSKGGRIKETLTLTPPHHAEDSLPRGRSNNQERKGKKKLVLALAGLSSYLCSLCAICQSVQARGWYPPHHNRCCIM
jgi:hypothetical protein